MKNIIDFIKDKIYYFMGGTVLLFVILIIIGSCSNNSTGNSYEKIEQNMINAAQKYYAKNDSALPVTEAGTVKVTLSALIESEYIKEVKDPKDKTNICTGYVEVTKIGDEYSYIPFLTCKGNYEPEYLTDKIKSSGLDEYGNGIYEENGEYIFKGDDVNNHVVFNDQDWRILKVDSKGDIKLILANRTDEYYYYDVSYNSEIGRSDGITSDYLQTSIRKSLKIYYDSIFSNESKAKIVSKDLCIGTYYSDDNFSTELECSKVKQGEVIGLINGSDYKNASLDASCVSLESIECVNRNYLSYSNEFTTWILNPSSENNYTAIYLSGDMDFTPASNTKRINPVIYLTSKAITNEGNGTTDKPYIIK